MKSTSIFVLVLRASHISALAFGLALSMQATAGSNDNKNTPNLSVQCSRSSSLVQIGISNCCRIGKVVLEIRDAKGLVLFHEEGKAMTAELVRRLDKGTLPKGTHTLSVTAKDFSVSQAFTVE